MFPMNIFFLKSELYEKSYSHLNIANLPLLYTFHSGAINPRHQLMSLVEVNLICQEPRKILYETKIIMMKRNS